VVSTRGVVHVHSSPTAVCPHVEWAVSGVLGTRVALQWSAQPAVPGQMRAEFSWSGPVGSGGALAGALRAWPMLRFEVTEEASSGVDGQRFCHVPGLGLWTGRMSANGDVMLGEDQIRTLMAEGAGGLQQRLSHALGEAWDSELESCRYAGDGAPVTWLHQVG
jgi:hypothetical protein